MKYLEDQKKRISEAGAMNTEIYSRSLSGSTSDSGISDGDSGSGSAPGTDGTDGSGNKEPFDPEAWGSGIGSLLGGVGDLIGGINSPSQPAQQPTIVQAPPAQQQSNSTMWVVLGIFAVILVVMMFFLLRKPAK